MVGMAAVLVHQQCVIDSAMCDFMYRRPDLCVLLLCLMPQVFVEQTVHRLEFPQFPGFHPHSTGVDFAITLGGDGTVL